MSDLNLITIYNICGLGNQVPINNYINSIESILWQSQISQKVVLSACMVSDEVKNVLRSHFKDKIYYNFIGEVLPLNVTYNHSAMLAARRFGVPQGFAYIDSGVTILSEHDLVKLWRAMMVTPDCGMITSVATSDNGYHWLDFDHPPAALYKIPIGKACHPHCHLFSSDIYVAYNQRLWPDIFASFCTESVFTFLCAVIKRNWYILRDVIVQHSHEMEGGSAGFRQEHDVVKARQGDAKGVWDHTFRSPRSMKEIISDPVGIAAGFGYEEIQGILPHDSSQFDENGWCTNNVLYEFLKENLYLKEEQLNYHTIKLDTFIKELKKYIVC